MKCEPDIFTIHPFKKDF